MKTYICSNCGKSASALDKFCQYCGGKIIENISSQINCPACGSAVNGGDEFCQVCGQRVSAKSVQKEEFRACAKCGTEIFDDDAFCPTCGERVNKGAAVKASPKQTPKHTHTPPTKPEKTAASSGGNGGKIAIIILLVLLIIALIGAGIIFFAPGMGFDLFGSQPSQTTAVSTVSQSSFNQTPIPNISVTVPPVTPEPESGINDPYGYAFPSDSTYITEEYLRTKTQADVRLILNEIYARHGYTFENRENIIYFGSKQWYVSRNKSMQACEAEFNNYERVNKETIVNYETSRGWR